MESIFSYSDYREFLKNTCVRSPAVRGLQAQLARAANCQASQLSQAFKQRIHLTEDQLIGIADYLKFSENETDFLILLMRKDKASTPRLKNLIASKIEASVQNEKDLSSKVKGVEKPVSLEDLSLYVSSWIPSVVHVLTSSPQFQNLDAIAARLSLPKAKIETTLEQLRRAEYVTKKGSNWIYRDRAVHIPKLSPLQSALQSTRRELASRSIVMNLPDSIHFSSVFTIDANELEKVRELAREFIKVSHEVIDTSGTSRLGCICLDVFEPL